MTSSAHERDKRSTGDHVSMTAENMISHDASDARDDDDDDDDDDAVNRPTRLKRDLRDYLVVNRRWTDGGKTVLLLLQRQFLADRTAIYAIRSIIGYCHATVVCLSVRLSVTKCSVAKLHILQQKINI